MLLWDSTNSSVRFRNETDRFRLNLSESSGINNFLGFVWIKQKIFQCTHLRKSEFFRLVILLRWIVVLTNIPSHSEFQWEKRRFRSRAPLGNVTGILRGMTIWEGDVFRSVSRWWMLVDEAGARRGREHLSRHEGVVVVIVTPVCWPVYQPCGRRANITSLPPRTAGIRLHRRRASTDLDDDDDDLERREICTSFAHLTRPTVSGFREIRNSSKSNID